MPKRPINPVLSDSDSSDAEEEPAPPPAASSTLKRKLTIPEDNYDSSDEETQDAEQQMASNAYIESVRKICQREKKAYVSSKGRFMNRHGVVYTPKPMPNGYSRVFFKQDMAFHRLVCRVFNGPPPSIEHKEVNHKDHDPTNNTPENLEWCTRTENNAHRKKFDNTALRSLPVEGKRAEDPEDAFVFYRSSAEAARQLGLDHSHVSHSAKHGTVTKGYEFRPGTTREPNMLEGEEWKSIGNGEISVSSLGRIFNKRFGTVYTPIPRSNGYCVVTILGKLQQVHRLVCEAFHGAPPGETTDVDHIDMDPSNNSAENLRWVTKSQNISASWERNNSRGTSASKTRRPVDAQRLGSSTWIRYESACEAARCLSLDSGAVSHRCKSHGTHGGYRFRYALQKYNGIVGEVWLPAVLGF